MIAGHDATITSRAIVEYEKCRMSAAYFITTYCKIYDATTGVWIPFDLWPEQLAIVEQLDTVQLMVVLKARQLGITWLMLCFALWLMIFRPISAVLIFSRRDDDATYLLGDERLRGIYKHLPQWLRAASEPISSSHQWKLSNGSTVKAFPTTGGDSYTASFALVDEADLVPDLNRLMRSVKPTIDAGGKLVLISRSDKSQPESEFKKIYIAAKAKKNGWTSVFLPWYVRPSRTQEWYDQQTREIQHRTGSLDDLYEQYPAVDAEALAPRSLDKRLNPQWLINCFEERDPLTGFGPAIPALRIFQIPVMSEQYMIGIDPAEGNPTSDDSSICVISVTTGEQVACMSGKIEPTVVGSYADILGRYYNFAMLMPERNNHGHSTIAWLQANSKLRILYGLDGKPGWLSSVRGKAALYDILADAIRNQETTIYDFGTFTQLSSIEGSTLRAPEGQLDDKAIAFALAWAAVANGGIFPTLRQARVKGR